MDTEKLKDTALHALEDMKGQNIVCMDVREYSSFADIMIVATGTSSRHVQSLAEEVVKQVKETGLILPRSEGEDQGEWVLLDLGDVIVHVMQGETRKLYDLESLWSMGNVREL